MSHSLQRVKEVYNAIVQVKRVNNKLLFYEASNLIVPKRVILTQNLKSIDVINCPRVIGSTIAAKYLTEFYYHNDTKVDKLDWPYETYEHKWEQETVELINKTIKLI
jgi:hypothetical protein